MTDTLVMPGCAPTRFMWRDEPRALPNQWTYFRRILHYDGAAEAVAHFAADPTARLWVNGSLALARVMRFVRPHITVERIDLRPHLRAGPNAIVVLHHHWGVPTFQRSPGEVPGFALALGGAGSDWRWRDAGEFLAHPHQTIGRDGSRRIRFPVVLDARRADDAIHEPSYDDAAWRLAAPRESHGWTAPVLKETPPLDRQRHRPVSVVASGHCRPPDLVAAPHPQVPTSYLMREASYEREPVPLGGDLRGAIELPSRGDGYITFDFGKPLHGYLELDVADASGGTVLDVAYGELPVRPDGSFDPEAVVGSPFGDRVVLRDGSQRIEVPEERTWRYLMLVWRGARGATRLRSVACMSSDHPVTVIGSYDGGPEHVAQTVRLCLDHARVTMSDTYVDTPGREDAQWLEDIEYRAQLAARWFGDVTLRQVAIRHAAEQQDPGGLFRVFAPEDYSTAGMQTLDWGMTWIGMLHDDWLWTGSTARVERHFGSLERFLDAAARRTDAAGLLAGEPAHSDIRIARRADAGKGERESIVNAWHHGYLRKAALLGRAIGRASRADEWEARATRLRAAFGRFIVAQGERQTWVAEVWSPTGGALPGYGQGATTSAVFHGLLEPAVARAAMASAFPAPDGTPPADVHRWNNPTYAYRVLHALCEQGSGAIAAAHLAERYGPYLPDGPLPEYFLREGDPIDPTGSHGWAAVPLLWLHDSVLGVRVARPGGDAISWQPVDVGWGRSCGTTMTPRGPCEVQVDWDERTFALEIPNDVVCEIALPERLGMPSAPGAAARDGFWRWTVRGSPFQTKLS